MIQKKNPFLPALRRLRFRPAASAASLCFVPIIAQSILTGNRDRRLRGTILNRGAVRRTVSGRRTVLPPRFPGYFIQILPEDTKKRPKTKCFQAFFRVWRSIPDSNRRPLQCERSALTKRRNHTPISPKNGVIRPSLRGSLLLPPQLHPRPGPESQNLKAQQRNGWSDDHPIGSVDHGRPQGLFMVPAQFLVLALGHRSISALHKAVGSQKPCGCTAPGMAIAVYHRRAIG